MPTIVQSPETVYPTIYRTRAKRVVLVLLSLLVCLILLSFSAVAALLLVGPPGGY